MRGRLACIGQGIAWRCLLRFGVEGGLLVLFFLDVATIPEKRRLLYRPLLMGVAATAGISGRSRGKTPLQAGNSTNTTTTAATDDYFCHRGHNHGWLHTLLFTPCYSHPAIHTLLFAPCYSHPFPTRTAKSDHADKRSASNANERI